MSCPDPGDLLVSEKHWIVFTRIPRRGAGAVILKRGWKDGVGRLVVRDLIPLHVVIDVNVFAARLPEIDDMEQAVLLYDADVPS